MLYEVITKQRFLAINYDTFIFFTKSSEALINQGFKALLLKYVWGHSDKYQVTSS